MGHDADDTTRENAPEVLDLDENGTAPPATPGDGTVDLAALLRAGEKWGWVDEDGGIHVRAGRYNRDRIVATVPPSRRAETLANLLLRFQELEDKYAALRKDLRRSRNLSRNLKSLQSFVHWAEDAEAIGDYDSLLGRAHAEIARLEQRLAEGRSAKLALVERAEALADSTKWKSTAEVLDELMLEWKSAGSAGREEDEALWERFNAARRAFFTSRNRHFAELKRSRSEVREAKEALIARATELATSTDYEGTFPAMEELLEEWKQAGSAGRDIDDQLWDSFRAAREPFFAGRRAHIAEQRRRQADAGRGRPDGRPRSREDGPRGRDRGGPPRRGRGGPGGPPQRRPRGGDPGVLRSSLADIVGPLRDLFPAERSSDGNHDADDGTPARGDDD